MPVLTLVDVLGIQRFVYGTNKLKDVVGGSWLVERATVRNGIVAGLPPLNSGTRACDAVIVGAGGNLLLRFNDKDDAREFAARYSRKLMEEAPGLDMCVVHLPYQKGELAQALIEIQSKMQKAKLRRVPSSPALGIAVDAVCAATGLPATNEVDPDDNLISQGVKRRREAFEEAEKQKLPDQNGIEGYDGPIRFPRELDDMGRSHGDVSLMGIVHVDGNGIGTLIADWLREQAESGVDDDTLIRKYQDISDRLKDLAERTFKAVETKVKGAITVKTSQSSGCNVFEIVNCRTNDSFQLRQRNSQLYLPLRPILVSGDDLTFVCDGRLALALAETALSEYRGVTIAGKSLSACAGVAIVKTHAPFARAYDLAEKLCTNAKRHRRKNNDSRSAIDWHIGLMSPSETLDEIRERQYQGSNLTIRPCFVDDDSQGTWGWLANAVLGSGDHGFTSSTWLAHRSKLKKLRELAARDSSLVIDAMNSWQTVHPDLKLPGTERDGTVSGKSVLLDAVELLDIYDPL